MVVPPVALHVGGPRHVTVYTFAAGFRNLPRLVTHEVGADGHAIGVAAENLVKAVRDGIDGGRVGIAAAVATQTKPVAR